MTNQTYEIVLQNIPFFDTLNSFLLLGLSSYLSSSLASSLLTKDKACGPAPTIAKS